ncbi:MAG TPA: choice-of-anchor tandem repeat GloVer-containing protein, partial [Steroidobacteraceae bacterium]|nr:choice-of-anchor tandem repeat GloVer-containing protein [Steroidobacteraceae bacterium]
MTDVDVLRDYLNGVMIRADHHADNVNEIALALAGAIVWRKDDSPIEVLAQAGEMKNALWVRINGTRYAVSYNHDRREIEIRANTTQGRTVASFSNASSCADVRRVTISSGATSFTFPALASGTSYRVTIQTQPSGLNCSVANGTGTISSSNVANVSVTCSATAYTVGGTISGLTASGLVLANGAATVSPAANATSFTMPTAVTSGTTYDIVVQTEPTGLTCSVTNASGTVGSVNVTNVAVSCAAASPYATLHSFGAAGDGATPYYLASLIQASDGNFYGMTMQGGIANNGTVFKISTSGTEAVLHAFAQSADGGKPDGGVLQASDGNLYGLTQNSSGG